MITEAEITEVGFLGKPHGINGEINLIMTREINPGDLSCIILDVEGINVPFFIEKLRQRGVESYLVTIDGINSEKDAALLVNKKVMALTSEVEELDEGGEDDEEGFYAVDFIGYRVDCTDGMLRGEIIDVDDSTENVLFVIRTDEGRQVLVPVADEFITDIDVENRHVEMDLPEGIVDL